MGSILAVLRDIGGYMLEPAFIATFLFFTLVIWIGMSGEDRTPLSSFSKAGLMAFIATAFLFVMISP
jgi:hypothetical protein